MRYAKQRAVQQKSYRLETMSGIDRSAFAGPGTLYDANNLTSDGRPYWKTRPPRGRWHYLSDTANETNSGLFPLAAPISGACSLENGLCFTAGKSLVIAGSVIRDVNLTGTERKQLIPMGRDLFIAPDGILLHKDAEGVWRSRSAGAQFISADASIQFGGSTLEATGRRLAAVSKTEPENIPSTYDWLDTSSKPALLKRYTEAQGWVVQEPQAWFFLSPGLHEQFRVGDIVNITAPGQFSMHSAEIFMVQDNMILVTGEIYSDDSEGKGLYVERPFPKMDFAVACGNRIWGCRHGENEKGEFVNEIFCSALGDALTWNRYGTGADDCYCASVGATGAFTGAAVLYDDVIFFKENAVICVSGTEPADFRIACNEGHGVRKGCDRSLARLGASLVYCGVDGVYRSNGIYTVRLCDGFPPMALENAVGGVLGEKYYMAAEAQNGERSIYVFTAGQDTWYREDDAYKVQFFVPQRNALYMLAVPIHGSIVGIDIYWLMIMITDHDAPGKYTNCMLSEGTDETDYGYYRDTDFDWYALTGELDLDSNETKDMREVSVRFELGDSALLCVELRTDQGERFQLGRFTGKGLRRRTLHVKALPCESVQLYLYGHGDCTIRDVEFLYESIRGEDSRV